MERPDAQLLGTRAHLHSSDVQRPQTAFYAVTEGHGVALALYEFHAQVLFADRFRPMANGREVNGHVMPP
jgi:hypothetical protein